MTLKAISSIAALAGALVCTAAESQPEEAGIKKLGAMLDVSRGRVYKVPYLKRCFERMSKMGYNSVMLYTEDTYRLEGVPKWGLTRGGYTIEDVKEIKAAADANGLELVPCIQTLGHLEKWLRWSDSADVRCNDSTVLVGEPKTYELIDKMVAFWQEGAGGSRIHVGMDEAWGFADGEYAKRNGNRPKFDVF
ncbi:beta-N-acetylhexosaminidase, partial [bacterium]|nr:beta-N-acetylhexosaminidase [bacterium]